MGHILTPAHVRAVRLTGLVLMAAGVLSLAGLAAWHMAHTVAARNLVARFISWLPWPVLVGGSIALLGAAVLVAALVRERVANRTSDKNLKKS